MSRDKPLTLWELFAHGAAFPSGRLRSSHVLSRLLSVLLRQEGDRFY